MRIKFFDGTAFLMKSSFYSKGDFMTIKNHFFKGEKNGHME